MVAHVRAIGCNQRFRALDLVELAQIVKLSLDRKHCVERWNKFMQEWECQNTSALLQRWNTYCSRTEPRFTFLQILVHGQQSWWLPSNLQAEGRHSFQVCVLKSFDWFAHMSFQPYWCGSQLEFQKGGWAPNWVGVSMLPRWTFIADAQGCATQALTNIRTVRMLQSCIWYLNILDIFWYYTIDHFDKHVCHPPRNLPLKQL